MLKIDVIKFEAQDVITTSVAQDAVAFGTCNCTSNCTSEPNYHNNHHDPCTPGFCEYFDKI